MIAQALILVIASLLVGSFVYGALLKDENDRLKWQLAEVERDVEGQFMAGKSDFEAGWNSALDAILWKVDDVKSKRSGLDG